MTLKEWGVNRQAEPARSVQAGLFQLLTRWEFLFMLDPETIQG